VGALKIYLDASVLVSLFATDAHSAKADIALKTTKPVPVVSDFAAAEFASAIARRVRPAI
jgi:predicted nucleic acid-binding protein